MPVEVGGVVQGSAKCACSLVRASSGCFLGSRGRGLEFDYSYVRIQLRWTVSQGMPFTWSIRSRTPDAPVGESPMIASGVFAPATAASLRRCSCGCHVATSITQGTVCWPWEDRHRLRAQTSKRLLVVVRHVEPHQMDLNGDRLWSTVIKVNWLAVRCP
jgi:hypothetical protein